MSTSLASGLAEGSLAVYTFAFQLSQLPVGVIGVSVAVALFPTLSQDAAMGRIGEIRRQVANAVQVLIFVAAPLTAIMVVLREPLTSVFYQYGLFSQAATDQTAVTLLFFAVGLGGHIVVHTLARAFYAMQDTRTPVTWAIIAVAVNVPLMVWLVGPMGVPGLALALSISSVLEVIGLLWSLRRRIDSVEGSAIARSLARAAVAGGAAAVVMLIGLLLVERDRTCRTGRPARPGRPPCFGLAGVGVAAFVAVAAALHSPELDQLRRVLRRRRPTAA